MIAHKHIHLLFCLLILPALTTAQSLSDFSPDQQKRLEKKWLSLTPQATLIRTDSTYMKGQVIFPTDSGIVWRSVPQYQPYGPSNIQLIPYHDISLLETHRQGNLGKHMINGGVIVGALVAGATSQVSRHQRNGWPVISTIGFLAGMGGGLISGLVIDKIRSHHVIQHPTRKTIRKSGSLYSFKNKDFWRKYWIENDSLIEGYALPPVLDKLRPFYQDKRFEFTGFLSINSLIGYQLRAENGSIHSNNIENRLIPGAIEFRLAYRLKPWLKLGLISSRTDAATDNFRLYHTSPDFHQHNYGWINPLYNRTLGAYVEYIPFPVKYLVVRRCEAMIGAGILRESGKMKMFQNLTYGIDGGGFYEITSKNQQNFQLPGGMVYLGMRFYAAQNVGLETQVGKYFFPSFEFNPINIDIVDPYPDIIFKVANFNPSRAYISFGTFVRL